MRHKQLLAALLVSTSLTTHAVTFDESVRYSKLVMDSRLNDFYANKKQMGFDVYDANGTKIKPSANPSALGLDYVPGLVGKAVLEAADYYSGRDEASARGWYLTIENFANSLYSTVPTSGGSLDDLEAVKIYAGLYDLSQGAFAPVAKSSTPSNAVTAMQRAAKGLKAHDNAYSIAASVMSDAAGGWYHKSIYPNQLWWN